MSLRATLQLCTFNRASLLHRVLQASFDQTVSPDAYEVVLVNDGSSDETADVIERAQVEARCRFVTIHQQNAGLARARNAGIARASGERIVFIDDDVLPMPNFIAEHLRSHAEHPQAVVRGAVINTATFDDLPPPIYTLRNYSGNFFWTSNVSLPLELLRTVGCFDENFAEYGWEDIELGLRLRAAGARSVFNRNAVVFHYKPPPERSTVGGMVRQARAQARTAVQLRRLHRGWRSALAAADTPIHRGLHALLRTARFERLLERMLAGVGSERTLRPFETWAARRLALQAYFSELERARRNPA